MQDFCKDDNFVEKVIPVKRKDILKKISITIHNAVADAEIILFGSEARGDATSGSDIDILILLERETLSYNEKTYLTDLLYEIELETGVLISPLILTREQWENRKFYNPFYINVTNEGVLL